ncbi:unnamed protein product [Xylocopa violacea]|uniref:BLUF domain-containing protein n=1 Tax=Xylocopa violacea TaxID=135666 RepID=A0ABP1PF38_XYLVO
MKSAVEPVRKSRLDIIRKNLRAAGKTEYVTRIVYIGEYIGVHSNLEERMESIVHDLQEDYVNYSITGLLLVYPQYFIHVFEASENIIYRHLKALYDREIEDCEIVRTIFLPTYHHVHQRFFIGWFHVYMIPPSLLQKIESSELEDIQLQTSNCFNKVYSLCSHISSAIHDTSIPMDEVMRNVNNRIARLYPESTLLEYLLNVKSPVFLTVEEYLRLHSTIPLINLYADTIWPPPRDIMHCTGFETEDPGKSVDLEKYRRPTRGFTD